MTDSDPATEKLASLNVEIGLKESAADKPFFRQLLHERLVFKRASGDVDDKKWFLEKLAKGEARETRVHDVSIHGDRAVVSATVTMKVDGTPRRFHNLRLFLRDPGGPWQLLAWANERTPD